MDFYHVLNRGVDKRVTFSDPPDYLRFIQNLHIYNNVENAPHNVWSTSARMKEQATEKLVTIHAYCLMPNHYHLLLSPLVDDGISLFMKKVNMGYTKYFNERNERTGALWQGKYKNILIEQDSHFVYIPYYIHLNPLDISMPQWRKGKVLDSTKAFKHLETYKWSSHRFFLNPEKIESSIIQNTFFEKEFKQQSKYLNEIKNIISTPHIAMGSETIEG